MVQLEVATACRHDIDDLVALSRSRLPGMTYLHDPEGWRQRARFGYGRHARDKLTMVFREGQDGALLAFCWVDDALANDQGIAEPWWCFNALAVDEQVAGHGLGSKVVEIVLDAAEEAGVSSVYGLCYPDASQFWAKQSFVLGEVGQDMRSTGAVRMLDGRTAPALTMGCEPGNHFFVMTLGDPADGHPRLALVD